MLSDSEGLNATKNNVTNVKVLNKLASINYFDSRRKNLTYILKWKSVMEMHVITKATKPSC